VEELRTPCTHRGSSSVLSSPLVSSESDVTIHICEECRRFWLERKGWLLSRRETAQVLRTVAAPGEAPQTLVR
jgi:hypothetical protein